MLLIRLALLRDITQFLYGAPAGLKGLEASHSSAQLIKDNPNLSLLIRREKK
jgi:hypothetical protein